MPWRCFLEAEELMVLFIIIDSIIYLFPCKISGLFFHVVGEGVVRLLKNGRQHIHDRENYIDFRMRLLGEPGKIN